MDSGNKAGKRKWKLYINNLIGLSADGSETKIDNGVIYSTREIYLDGRYDYKHDILIMNQGTEPINNLGIEIVSDEVELDNYWTLSGKYELKGFNTEISNKNVEKMPNLAKIRIKAKENKDDGRDISGTLKIKSGDSDLIVLKLTGRAGDPSITTTEIPPAVKYVPYGTMIQNSNKYDWNNVRYYAMDRLPDGMDIKPNGEIYGVPTEAGEFTFTIRMTNSSSDFASSKKTFTMVVTENTNENVDKATDHGYELTKRVPDIMQDSINDQTMISEGLYEEFVDLFLDGERLERDIDYNAESGSTRITIKAQTLTRFNTPGTHTLGAEFRTKDTNVLKRAAQNYIVKTKNGSSNGSGGNNTNTGNNRGNHSTRGSKGSNPDPADIMNTTSLITKDSKKVMYILRQELLQSKTQDILNGSRMKRDGN